MLGIKCGDANQRTVWWDILKGGATKFLLKEQEPNWDENPDF